MISDVYKQEINEIFSLFKAKNPVATKYLPYESGIKKKTELFYNRYFLRHYLVALIFLVFDIEVVFLYPWAVVAKEIGTFAFYEIVFFIGTSVIGLAYIWKKGGLKWE